jgi:hypothetical protein
VYGDGIEYTKSPDFQPIHASLGKPGATLQCLAGDAVLIAPVSCEIPCYQGILQGILLFSDIPAHFGL